MFTSAQPSVAWPRLAAVVVAGALVFGAGVALVTTLGSGHVEVAGAATSGQLRSDDEGRLRSVAPPEPTAALELVALEHDRTGGRLTVRGIVRNPADGSTMQQLTAVVVLFNRDGGFLTSGRALAEVSTLAPGGETTFRVTVPGAAAVQRYRVSFRSEERAVPHVDIRG